MKLSTEALQRALENAHIAMSEEECTACLEEVAFLLGWAKQLEALPLEGVRLTTAVNLPDNCTRRPDVATPSMGTQQALAQAPATAGSCFLVPKIIE